MEELFMEVNDRVEFLEYQNKGKKGTIIKFVSDINAIVVIDGEEDDVPTIANINNLKVI